MPSPKSKWFALLGGAALLASTALADDRALIDLLVKKGIVNADEASQLAAEAAKKPASTPVKISATTTEFRISGDLRVRYEFRSGQDQATGDNVDRNRFRYRLRPTFTGQLGSQWFYGFRIENGNGARSSNVTMGADGGPWAKGDDGLYFGQVYLGYKATDEITLIAGRMPNPFVSTSLTWDGDICPEGIAEQYKHDAGNVTWFANLGQFLYDSANPQNGLGASHNDQYLLGWQAGATVKLANGNTLTAAPAIYNYVNNNADASTKYFAATFTPTTQNGINNLFIFDLPVDYTMKLGNGAPLKLFGDVAYNADGDERARKYGRPDLDNEVWAWQLGAQYGKAKKKGDWDAKAFYQQTDLFALDPNLVDSDLFDSRVNMEGVVLGANYQLTDALTFSVTYANGETKNKSAISAGSGDLSLPTMKSFSLLQLDIIAKF